jgi:dipeptidyl aminopeptidase/acylaminoacyl peptidase
MLRTILLACFALSFTPAVLAQGAAASANNPANTEVPLIERANLFGNPSKTAGSISPDGKWLSWIAPRDGVLNVWVAPIGAPNEARPLTAEKTRPIRTVYWAPDSTSLLFINDKGGDENFLLYGVDIASGKQTLFTPFEKTRVQIINISRHVKDRILVGINNRDPRWHDAYSLDLKSGKLNLVYKNVDDYGELFADEQLNLRVASKSRKDGGIDYYRLAMGKDRGKAEETPFVKVDLDDALTTSPQGFTTDGKTLYWSDSRGRDTAALVAQDIATGATKVVAQDARADIGAALFDPRTGRAQAYELEYLRRDYVPLDRALAPDLAWLKGHVKGDLTIRSRDGLNLVSYLSLPKAAGADADGKPARPVPMVLLVHGGPWGRDSYGYYSFHQWLANRGYAVLSVNFRGSTGFGKGFINAGDHEWGRKMHDDLLDAVDWAVRNGVTTREKVAIMGGSYGGYATLAGMSFTPATFACGVDIVGPSNLFTLLETIPPYWEAFKQQFYKRMGDPTTEEGRALLKERSPLNFADRIARPLLIGQGANDPRVNVRESDQIVAAMNARHIPVTYIVFPDEGHGFARPVNNIAFNAVSENFLAPCLGGRAEPIGTALQPSTAQVRQGAEFVPGLQQAPSAK